MLNRPALVQWGVLDFAVRIDSGSFDQEPLPVVLPGITRAALLRPDGSLTNTCNLDTLVEMLRYGSEADAVQRGRHAQPKSCRPCRAEKERRGPRSSARLAGGLVPSQASIPRGLRTRALYRVLKRAFWPFRWDTSRPDELTQGSGGGFQDAAKAVLAATDDAALEAIVQTAQARPHAAGHGSATPETSDSLLHAYSTAWTAASTRAREQGICAGRCLPASGW